MRRATSATSSLGVSLAVHGLVLAALVWHAAPVRMPAVAGTPGRPMLLWLHAAARSARWPALQPVAVAAVPRTARLHPLATVPVIDLDTAAPASTAAPTGVSGIAFAPPRLRPFSPPVGGSGGGFASAPNAAPPTHAAGLPSAPPPAVLLQPMVAAAKAQLGQALSRQLSELPAPVAAGEGRCTLNDDAPAALRCDDDRLQQALADHAGALAGLLRAYRHADPQVVSVAVAFHGGRYRLDIR